jgi:hypothetical protein
MRRRRRHPTPQYVTVAGKAVRGVEESAAERKERKQQKGNRTPPQYAFGSYQQVGWVESESSAVHTHLLVGVDSAWMLCWRQPGTRTR